MNDLEKHTSEGMLDMGPLERAAYKSDWRAAKRYRRSQGLNAQMDDADQSVAEADDRGQKAGMGFEHLRSVIQLNDIELDESGDYQKAEPVAPGRTAARLMFARLFDANPGLLRRLKTETPVVIIDVPEQGLHGRVVWSWRSLLGFGDHRVLKASDISDAFRREDFDVICAVAASPIGKGRRDEVDGRAYLAVQFALPVIAITPGAETHLSKVFLDAATDRLVLPPMDAGIIRKVIRIATGRRCRQTIPEETVANVGLHELLLAVRFDRSPTECIARLNQLVQAKLAKRGPRDLSLDDLYGLDEAVAWAKSTKADLDAWRRGEIGWGALDAGLVVDGPAGVGKTLFAKLAAEHFGLPMIAVTMAKWQGSGEGHLGHLLRDMKADFEAARRSPCVFFVDELDSFPDRASISHQHKDYVVAMVNGFIEQIDGLHGRDGIVFIGATNDVRRCDPAIVRSGRFNRIIRVGLPSDADIEKMMRVRLAGDLLCEPIKHIAELAAGSSGADVERMVKDARRIARSEGRPIELADLRAAVIGKSKELSPAMLERAAIHEAGHIVTTVLLEGPSGVHAVVANMADAAGFVARRTEDDRAGTLEDYRAILVTVLAGRAAEELVLGNACAGSGGVANNSDLAVATKLGAALVASVGLAGPHPLVFLADHYRAEDALDQPYMRMAVQKELQKAFSDAKRMLAENVVALTMVADRLKRHGRVEGSEVKAILDAEAAMPPVLGLTE